MRRATLSLSLILALLCAGALVASAAPTAPAAESWSGGTVVRNPSGPVLLRHDPRNVPTRIASRVSPSDHLSAPLSTFTVNYMTAGTSLWDSVNCEAWPPEAQASFDYATTIWASLVKSGVPITIDACWTPSLAAGILGGSTANAVDRDFAGAPTPGTWYPIALANALNGSDRDPGRSDMSVALSSDANWYFGQTGTPPEGVVDFASVVLHEVGHGLGFTGTMEVSGGQGRWGYVDGSPTGLPMAFDRFAVNGSGQKLLSTSLFPNPSTQLAAQLTSENLYFDGAQAKAANGGNRPELYAPPTWAGGSSYSHLDVSYNGTANALMTFDIASQEVVHDPGPIGLAILNDVGWHSRPTIISISPTGGIVGAKVTISGTNLKEATSVSFGSTPAVFTVNSAAQITATVPPGAVTGPVQVTTPLGTATSASDFTVVVCYALTLSHDGTGVDPTASPTKSSLCPTTGQYVAGEAITLTAHPGPGYQVARWSGTIDDSSTSTTNSVTMPAAVSGASVSYVQIPPTITGFDPASGPVGTVVTILGTSLSGATSVTFGGTAASISANTATQIVATVLEGATPGPISVTTPGGTATSASDYGITDVVCHALTLGHTGNGADPATAPTGSTGCAVGQYVAGEAIALTAQPAADYHVSGWAGTDEDSSKALTNTLTMPAAARKVSVAYSPPPQVILLPQPARFVDTRPGSGYQGAGQPLPANAPRCYQVAGWGEVPNDAIAAVVNLTAAGYTRNGWIAAYPSGESFSGTSSLNFDTRENSIANFAIVRLGADGKACLLASEAADAIVDVSGYLVSTSVPQIAFLAAPKRVVDTRSGSGYLGAGQPLQGVNSPRCYTLAGKADVPPDAQAVIVNLTAVGYTKDGWIAAYPYDPTKLGQVPSTSSVNFDVDENAIANFAIVKLGSGGQVCLTGSSATNAIIDVSGYLAASQGGAQVSFVPSPVRVVDTRSSSGYTGAGKPLQGQSDPHGYLLAGQAGVPGDATAVIVNVTAVGYAKDGWIAQYPSGGLFGSTSSVNYDTDENAIANFAIAKLGPDGKLVLLSSSPTNAIVDVSGYLR